MGEHGTPADRLYAEYRSSLHRRTDVMFGVLLVLQLIGAVVAALLISPKTWIGEQSHTHVHVWAALGLGAAVASLPLALIVTRRGHAITRQTIGVAQMLFSALLIHVTGGRIETHFHVFGSLAFLAIYRDWKVLIPATLVIATDHLVRGVYWPQSVFGVLAPAPWRALEHAAWVLFEDVFLAYSCVVGAREMRAIAQTQASLQATNASIEATVHERTAELEERTAALRASEERYALAMLGSRDGLWDWDLATNTVYYAPRWRELLGLSEADVGRSPDEWFKRIASSNLAAFLQAVTAHVDGLSERFDLELEMIHADGEPRWFLCRAAALRDGSGQAVRLVGSLADVTELKRTQEELRRMAQHDRLTGLPNREYFAERLSGALAQAAQDARRRLAVLFFDFDRFKVVNDSLGHRFGDALLQQIAKRFRRELRPGDVAARFGGDEFVVLLDRISGVEEAEGVCRRLLKAFEAPHNLDGHEIVSTASVGLVTSDLGYTDASEMIRDADAAMYQAKAAGKAQHRVFDSQMHAAAIARLHLEQDLRRAVERSEFELWYQPIVTIESGEVAGFEALIRWQHPEHGLLSPETFVSLAEETGDIVPIGRWVCRTAVAQLLEWQEDAELGGPLFMSINFSKRQIVHPSLCPLLESLLTLPGLNPRDVRIEITESTVMDERADMAELMARVRALGFRLSMDDFGTGHSSLSCLHRFPIDVLKIDRSFVVNMEERRELTAVMFAIVTLAHNLGLTVVAEGIETSEQVAQLQGMDCEYGQGFYFARPLTPGAARELLRRRARQRRAA